MQATTQTELVALVDAKAEELGFTLRNDLGWKDNADYIRENFINGADEMADFLEAAEKAWFRLES